MYFTSETQAFIIDYQQEESITKRKEVYTKHLLPAFSKLSENLIFVYGFKPHYCTFEELKADCVSFLYESIPKWDPARGTKAFSYFNVVAKNWLIVNCRQHKKMAMKHVSVDYPESMSSAQKEILEEKNTLPSTDELFFLRQRKFEIIRLLDDMAMKLNNENELLCLEAVKTLFRSIDDLDLLNKRAVLVYIREISGLDKKQMAKALGAIRKHYRAMMGSNPQYEIF
jgi:hypothetical protein